MKKKKVLVLCTRSGRGGVDFYYVLVEKYFISERVIIDFYFTGKTHHIRKHRKNAFIKSLLDLSNLIKLYPYYDLIILNPSLDAKAVIRDAVYHTVAKRIFKKRTLVFFRGWQPDFEQLIDKYGKSAFRFFFNCDKVLVLSNQFKNKLVEWGFNRESICLETTTFEQHEYDIDKNHYNIIFLSRFTRKKGCLEAIQSIEILRKEFPQVKLFMVGDGEITPDLKRYVKKHNLGDNVEFTGWLSGKEKHHVLHQCSMMVLPSSREGMPNSILEGMGAGLAIISTPAGGIPEIITDGENGFLVNSFDPKYFAEKIKYLFENRGRWKDISMKNIQVAKEKFEIKEVVKRLEQFFFEMAR